MSQPWRAASGESANSSELVSEEAERAAPWEAVAPPSCSSQAPHLASAAAHLRVEIHSHYSLPIPPSLPVPQPCLGL
eukprot:1988773-Rhodomonas_salina.6